MFILFNGTHFLANLKMVNGLCYNFTRYLDEAKKFNSVEEAQHEIDNMNYQVKKKGYWKVMDETQCNKYYNKNNTEAFHNSKIENENLNRSQVKFHIQELKDYKLSLLKELKLKENEQQDLLHYCEFYDCEEDKSREFFETLKNVRQRRRFIKTELFRIDKILQADSTEGSRYYLPKTNIPLFLNKRKNG